MNYTISMTDILLTVSVGCNLWFLFLLFTTASWTRRLVRFFKSIVGLWRSLDGTAAKRITAHKEDPAEKTDIIGKSRFRMASTRTTAAIPTQEAATSEKGIELSEEEATFDDGNTENAFHPAQVPEEKLDETFTSIRLRNWSSGRRTGRGNLGRTTGIGKQLRRDRRCGKTAKNPDATQAEREKAAKVFTDMEGTELYEKMMEGSSEIGIRIKGLIEIRLKKSKRSSSCRTTSRSSTFATMYDNNKRNEHERMTSTHAARKRKAHPHPQRTRPRPWKQTGIH